MNAVKVFEHPKQTRINAQIDKSTWFESTGLTKIRENES